MQVVLQSILTVVSIAFGYLGSQFIVKKIDQKKCKNQENNVENTENS